MKLVLALCCSLSFWGASFKATAFETLALKNAAAEVTLTPDIGGRLLSYAQPGKENILALGEAFFKEQKATLSAEAENIAYLGHINWVGPQSAWWQRQNLNPQRKALGAMWPPDPYIEWNANSVLSASANRIVLQGQPSPISGVRIDKSFTLHESGALQLDATLVNTSDAVQQWDLWFNTRVHASAQVYFPVSSEAELRYQGFDPIFFDNIEYRLSEGLLSLKKSAGTRADKMGRQGKLLIQPRAAWMAAFDKGLCLIIRFRPVANEHIHPEHGQLELYASQPNDPQVKGLIEMELHSPFVSLAPGATLSASETWSLYPYSGADDGRAHEAFLRQILAQDF